jgi:UTP-glucose-1-phosphate uridylyltransferase
MIRTGITTSSSVTRMEKGKRSAMGENEKLYFDRHFELESMLERKGESRLLEEVRRSSNMVDIGYIRQKEQLWLGHAVLTAKNMIGNEPFFLMLPDDLFENRELVTKRCCGYMRAIRAV